MGVEWTPNKSQHTMLTLEGGKNPPLFLPGFELATFQFRVRRSTNELFRLPHGATELDFRAFTGPFFFLLFFSSFFTSQNIETLLCLFDNTVSVLLPFEVISDYGVKSTS